MRRLVHIRDEIPSDRAAVAAVHARAFGSHGDVVVPLVEDLRDSLSTEQGLSLVAEDDGEVVGHVMFTRNVLDAPPRLVDVQVLSPLGVLPERQRRGIGRLLVQRGVEELSRRGVPLVFLEGSPVYYSRLGFVPGRAHSFRRPSLRIPHDAFQVMLLPAYEEWMTGTLVYRQAFWDHDSVGLRDA